jgi:hypothetical protein
MTARPISIGVRLVPSLLAAALTCGCAGQAGETSPKPAHGATSSPAAPTKANPSAPSSMTPKQLLADLLPLPKHATAWKSQTGYLSFNQAINALFGGGKEGRALAKANRLRFMVRRGWMAADGSQVEDQILSFSSAAGARGYVHALDGGDLDLYGSAHTSWTTAAGGAHVYVDPKLNSAGEATAVTRMAVKTYVVELSSFTPARPDRSRVITLLRQQYARLTGSTH